MVKINSVQNQKFKYKIKKKREEKKHGPLQKLEIGSVAMEHLVYSVDLPPSLVNGKIPRQIGD